MLPLVYYKIWIAIIFHERVNIYILLVSTGYRVEREGLGDGTVSALFTKIGKKHRYQTQSTMWRSSVQ